MLIRKTSLASFLSTIYTHSSSWSRITDRFLISTNPTQCEGHVKCAPRPNVRENPCHLRHEEAPYTLVTENCDTQLLQQMDDMPTLYVFIHSSFHFSCTVLFQQTSSLSSPPNFTQPLPAAPVVKMRAVKPKGLTTRVDRTSQLNLQPFFFLFNKRQIASQSLHLEESFVKRQPFQS